MTLTSILNPEKTMIDLASLDALTTNAEDGAKLTVTHPVTGDPIGLTLTVAGSESELVRKIERKQANERLRTQRRTVTVEDIERNARDRRTAKVRGWEFDGLNIDGATPAYSKEEVEKLLRRFPWIADQVDTFSDDLSNYAAAAA